ncbi:MAG: dephospho-CoA kinase, partial [Ignavibacteria bacterium]
MQSKKLVIGITGGVGSGKSVACKYFEKLGYRVIYADVVAKELYKTNKNLRALLVKEFGKGILDSSGRISYINARKIIFSKKSNIKRVNSIVHPFVIDEIDRIIIGS